MMVEVLKGKLVFWSVQVVPGKTVTTAAREAAAEAAKSTATDIERIMRIPKLGVSAIRQLGVAAPKRTCKL